MRVDAEGLSLGRIPVEMAKTPAVIRALWKSGGPGAVRRRQQRLTTGTDAKFASVWGCRRPWRPRFPRVHHTVGGWGKAVPGMRRHPWGNATRRSVSMDAPVRRISVFVAETGFSMGKRNRSAWTPPWRLRAAPSSPAPRSTCHADPKSAAMRSSHADPATGG